MCCGVVACQETHNKLISSCHDRQDWEAVTGMERLPTEVLTRIFSWLQPDQLTIVVLVSRLVNIQGLKPF